jgi:hypothetical protein
MVKMAVGRRWGGSSRIEERDFSLNPSIGEQGMDSSAHAAITNPRAI